MPTPADYSWINDSHLEQAACVTVVPAADRAAVLAAYGAREGSGFVAGSLEDAPDPFVGSFVQVVDVGDALVVIEDNGFEGTRPEVLEPLSRASRDGVAAAFFWNVNALTTFTAARSGAVEFSVELLGIDEADDEELPDVPAHLRALVVEGGSEDGDMCGAGLALVATHTGIAFTAATLDAGTWYEIEPTPERLTTRTRGQYDPLDFVAGGTDLVEALPPATQRALAEWATRAAVRESGMDDDPVVREVLAGFGSGRPVAPSDGLDQLARTTAREHQRFVDLEADLEAGGRDWPRHPYYEAVVPGDFGDSRALSHLEGCFLGQRRCAVEAVRRAANPDSLTAAVDCLTQSAGTFENGRTTRGWTFEENADGRWQGDTLPNPRREQFVRALSALLAELASGGPDVWARADAALPQPLSGHERVEAIHADAVAAARGEFATYQISRVDDTGDGDWGFGSGDGADWDGAGWDDGGIGIISVAIGGEGADGLDLDPATRAELESAMRSEQQTFLTEEIGHLDTVLRVLEQPGAALATISAAPSALDAVAALDTAFGIGEPLARELLATRLRPVRADDVQQFRDHRATLAHELDRLRRH